MARPASMQALWRFAVRAHAPPSSLHCTAACRTGCWPADATRGCCTAPTRLPLDPHAARGSALMHGDDAGGVADASRAKAALHASGRRASDQHVSVGTLQLVPTPTRRGGAGALRGARCAGAGSAAHSTASGPMLQQTPPPQQQQQLHAPRHHAQRSAQQQHVLGSACRYTGASVLPWSCQAAHRTAHNFAELDVCDELQAGLASLDCHQPLPIQARAFPVLVRGSNCALQSCTGSGKTLAYLVPLLQRTLAASGDGREPATAPGHREQPAAAAAAEGARGRADANRNLGAAEPAQPVAGLSAAAHSGPKAAGTAALGLQILIVAPSRELCIQIMRAAQQLLPAPRRHQVQQLIGSANPKRQAEALSGSHKPLVVVGTPGRVAQMIDNGSLHVWRCPVLVLDEVDHLWSHHDYRAQVDAIASHVGRRVPGEAAGGGSGQRQTVIVSASLEERTLRRYTHWCPSPCYVSLPPAQALPLAASPGSSRAFDAAVPAEQQQVVNAEQPQSNRPQEQQQQWRRQHGEKDEPQGSRTAPARPEDAEADGVVDSSPSRASTAVTGRANASLRAAAPLPLPQAGLRDGQPVSAASNGAAATGPTATAAAGGGAQSASAKAEGVAVQSADAEGDDAGSGADAQAYGVLPPHLQHLYVLSPTEHRTDKARRLIHALGAERVLVFVTHQHHAMVTKYKLEARNMAVTVLHGKLSKMERSNITDAFRRGVFRAMVVTDLAARGLDVPACDAVLNLGLPRHPLTYAHRAGRAGRAGAPGVVVSIVDRHELAQLRQTARRLAIDIKGAAVTEGLVIPTDAAAPQQEPVAGGAAAQPSGRAAVAVGATG